MSGDEAARAPDAPGRPIEDPRASSRWQADAEIWRRRLVVALGGLWILDGLLQLQPSMYSRGTNGFLATVLQYNTMGKPNPVTDFIHFAVTFTYGTAEHQMVFNSLAALVQLAIGVGLLLRRSERPALVASCCWAVIPWVVGEALGQMVFPQSSMAFTGAPGAAFIYILLGLALWPLRRSSSPEVGAPAGSQPHSAAEEGGLLGRSGAHLVWAAIWVGTAMLELERANWAPDAISAQLRDLAIREPAALGSLDHALARATFGHGTEIALAMALVQAWIGISALRPATRTVALGAGITVSLAYWILGQNFGGLLTGTSSDPNLGPLMVLFALALWPRPDPSVVVMHNCPRDTRTPCRGREAPGESGQTLTRFCSRLRRQLTRSSPTTPPDHRTLS